MDTDLELKPAMGGRVAIAFLTLLCFGLAALLLVPAARHARHDDALAIGLGCAVLGVVLLWLTVGIGRRRLILDRDGVTVRGVLGTKRIAWSAVSSYSFVSIDPSSQAYYGQGAVVALIVVAVIKAVRKKPQNRKFKGGRLVLHGRGGEKVTVMAWFRDIDQGLERIFAELHPRLAATTGAGFGKLAFDGRILSHETKGVLALPEIEKVVVSPNGMVSIRKVGKRLAWASIGMAKIPCSLLLFERLADHGVAVEMSDAVFLPLPTLGLLARLKAARESLPRARIHS
ncbi:MAG TPA: PH domain-containing protein [Kofleriaceae bacterium]|nr:PH domain-containing protein [Kofleriaceae bacterium]